MGLFEGVKGIYFDLDDTLCGYWDAARCGLRKAFEAHPVAGKSTDDSVQAWSDCFKTLSPDIKGEQWYERYLKEGGSTRTELMRRTLSALESEDETHAARLSDAYAHERDAALALFPDAERALDALHGRYPLGLITNGPADVQRQEVKTLGIARYFEHVFIEGELGFGKPLEAVFHRAAEAMGLGPEQLVMVGNSYGHDIEPALCAGWRAVWIRRDSDVPPSSKNGRPEELGEGQRPPTLTASSLDELLDELP